MEPTDETTSKRPVVDSTCLLRLDGRVGVPTEFDLRDLLARTSRIGADAYEVPLLDLLAVARLDAIAEVLVATGPGQRPLAIPLVAIIREIPAFLVIGQTSSGRSSLSLAVAGWTDDEAPARIDRLQAMTFAEFVLQR